MSVRVPPSKKGFMKKQGRKGLIKNWKTRYFVLEAGKMSYYVNKLDVPPYGSDLKGEMSLSNTDYVEDYTKNNECQIYLVSYNGENNMLMEAETAADANEWIAAIKLHLKFADANAADVATEHVAMKRRSAAMLEPLRNEGDGTWSTDDSKAPVISIPTASKRDSRIDVPLKHEASTASIASDSTSSVSTPVVATQQRSTSPAVVMGNAPQPRQHDDEDDDGPPMNTLGFKALLVDGLTSTLSTFTVVENRNAFLASVTATAKVIAASLSKNLQEGELGTRGEEWAVVIFVLSFIVLFGVGRYLYALISLLIQLSSVVYIVCGMALVVCGVWELRTNVSPFLAPVKDNTLVKTGVYSLVRHPMYGGLVLICIGRAIIARSMEKLLLSLVLAFIINIVAHIEENLMNKAHPRKYKAYSRNKKKLIPFLY